MCTTKPYDILKIKNVSVKSVCYVMYNPFCNLVVFIFPRRRSSLLASNLGSELMKNRNTVILHLGISGTFKIHKLKVIP